jgi:hypothetical protein
MNHSIIRKINETEKEICTQLYISFQETQKVLLDIQPTNPTDDYLLKRKEIQTIYDYIIQKKPEWRYAISGHLRTK